LRNLFTGKTALVTGGSSGIGLAIARALAGRGSHIWLAARDIHKLKNAVELVLAERVTPDQKVCFTSADISDCDQATRLVERVTREAGTPDILVNSAGIVHPGYVQ
jgi:NAD(P)-dependent dehydrogenase (short-subunit alcohol dehydrogenase family)